MSRNSPHSSCSGIPLGATINPKKRLSKPDDEFICVEYYQVFAEKHGFIPNLSIIDLLFNEGTNAVEILNKSAIV